ncbi:helix-turn-helix domain-containing protein [Cohnella cellulosilytica]|uniref:Helix-turn-helix domain-containing protein n=2 Tax=Cohnella cellulosilytica TaxID=986710 RepID=A0ABW2FIR3_9BACL
MQEHYNEALTRKQLAQIAGLSPWHYSRKFNEYRGMPPLEFLARYRMYRAQELLLLTSATMQHIAWQVGFEDVHYFSRRFKQLTGVSPRNCGLHPTSRRIVALTPLCADMLIRFGTIPHAVAATPLLLTERQLRQLEEHRIKLLPSPQFHLDTELIARTQPDLIIGAFITEEVRMRLRAIAPIISVDHSDAELLIQQLAALFDKEAEGRSLLAQMQREREAARSKLSPLLQSRATVMALRVEPFGYRYLGGYAKGISELLYRNLGLSLPEPLKAGEAWFNPCSLELLTQANPDYLFVEKRVMEHFDAEAKMNELKQSPGWQRLKAVRLNRVFYVDTRQWVEGYGADGQKMLLDQIVAALTASV